MAWLAKFLRWCWRKFEDYALLEFLISHWPFVVAVAALGLAGLVFWLFRRGGGKQKRVTGNAQSVTLRKKLKELRKENVRLKEMVADLSLDKAELQGENRKNHVGQYGQ